ncbi:MAG: class I SAM-dependent methyltransferase [Chitinophagaceae bacterium]|nr:class I SAM-dependent methyltransferase [Chitinophagaceae bacterium]MBL0055600.1 class I SAM-dependent methyltransferase [Chitinophagaceae bacterium]
MPSFPPFYDRGSKQLYQVGSIPLIDGIPRFVESGSYASLFGDQWKRYKKTQLDSFSGSPISENRLNRCLGDLKDHLNDKLVLEAGCGAGRFTEILLKKGATLVSADLSSAVEVNAENFPVSEKHQVIQADINDMPYADETFDVVICMGVIQHTPDPEQTIRNLYALVKKGGRLVIDHYTFNRSRLFRLHYFYRMYYRKQPASVTIPATRRIVGKYLPLHKRFAHNKLMSVLLNRISPVTSYYSAFPQLNDRQQEEWALLDTHDGLTDWYKWLRNKKQIRSVLEELGAVDIWCEYGGNGVEANAKKPM